ncbi:hypothetical protein Vadar_008348 [Vaccinium darrowii]|uniref:Uncharacterized protein n=1 Tax=Vaccinium darrowii TaxID=229202 RepID=A0ACB7X910_9ERIC|nr:hypothetical protein Vadar_008348 [Vaccinium darrowii]
MISVPSASKNATSGTAPNYQHQECRGERVDLVVRLGLLKLVSGVSSLTQKALAETLKLNLTMPMAVQDQLHKIIAISTSGLVLQQTLLSEQRDRNSTDMETIILSAVKQLLNLF